MGIEESKRVIADLDSQIKASESKVQKFEADHVQLDKTAEELEAKCHALSMLVEKAKAEQAAQGEKIDVALAQRRANFESAYEKAIKALGLYRQASQDAAAKYEPTVAGIAEDASYEANADEPVMPSYDPQSSTESYTPRMGRMGTSLDMDILRCMRQASLGVDRVIEQIGEPKEVLRLLSLESQKQPSAGRTRCGSIPLPM